MKKKEVIDLQAIGRRIANLLEKIGKNQTWLADEMGVTDSTVSDWVHGKRSMTLANLVAIGKLLKASLNYLAIGKN